MPTLHSYQLGLESMEVKQGSDFPPPHLFRSSYNYSPSLFVCTECNTINEQ